ncbi:MAG TPA: hypothetical protein VFS00_12895, partial [Polyangiaceae bacterium]|nr:hypothetical protein [Polyangiaceae bacterium]
MKRRSNRRSGLGVALGSLLKLAWWSLVICLPLCGAWVASSLAAYANKPPWAAALAGLLLFPIAPLAWEGLATWRRRGASSPRFLTLGDRVVLRTLALSLAFLALVLGSFPRDAFTALTVRGDWALEGRSGDRVEAVRRGLFALAGRLEWLYLYASEKNPYGESDRGPTPGETPADRGASGAPTAPAASTNATSSTTPLASSKPSTAGAPVASTAPSTNAAPVASAASSTSAAPVASAAPSTNTSPVASAAPSTNAAPVASTAPSTNAAPVASAASSTKAAGESGEGEATTVAWPLAPT